MSGQISSLTDSIPDPLISLSAHFSFLSSGQTCHPSRVTKKTCPTGSFLSQKFLGLLDLNPGLQIMTLNSAEGVASFLAS